MNTGNEKVDLLSIQRLSDDRVHPDLRKFVMKFLAAMLAQGIRISLTEVMRDIERQKKLVAQGSSWTMNSRHLTGHAVDVALWVDVDGDGDIEPSWAWPLYRKSGEIGKAVALGIGVPMEWGGDWKGKKADGPHWQLAWSKYPK